MKRMVLAIIGATRWVICVQMQVSSEKAQKKSTRIKAGDTRPETNISPLKYENRPSQKESSIPTIHF